MVLLLLTFGATARLLRVGPDVPAAAAAAPGMTDLEIHDADIEFYSARALRDTASALDRARLATLYLQRGRESGDPHDAIRAEQAARASLALRTAHNTSTLLVLASALLEQHRFVEARRVAEQLLASDSANELYRSLLAETQLELGDYAAARSSFRSIMRARSALPIAPRLARWEEIQGRDNIALRILKGARDSALTRSDLPREQVAWFHLRIGQHELRRGHVRAARRAMRDALAIAPDDHRVLAALASLEASRENWTAAIELGERSLAKSLDAGTLATLASAYRATGDADRAAEYDRVLDAAFVSQSGPFHRDLSLYLLDRGRHIPLVLAKAKEEIRERRDVYGYDVLAWALFRAGQPGEARAATAQALRMGTDDPLLHRHAAAIAAGGGP